MSESMVLELISLARDAARAGGKLQLAEHLDDAMLVAASAFHAAAEGPEVVARDDTEDTEPAGDIVQSRLH